MNVTIRRASCCTILAGVMAGTAFAAEPESGTVSSSSPKVNWSGVTTASYPARIAASQNDDFPCEAPACDAFALKVETAATLTLGVTVDSTGDSSLVTTRVHKPDGSIVKADSPGGGAADGKVFKVVIKNAPTGDYTIDHFNNAPGERKNESYAELAVAAAPAPAAPAPAPAPAPQPAPAAGAPSGTVQAIDLAVKVGKASARKLARSRKLAAKVTVSREVDTIVATLKKGRKVVGKGSLGKTSGTKAVSIKLPKKFRKGSYALTVVATAGQTSTTKTVKVSVGK